MVLAIPHHLECVDSYPHKGSIGYQFYNTPWEKGKSVNPHILIGINNIVIDPKYSFALRFSPISPSEIASKHLGISARANFELHGTILIKN